MAEQDDLRVNGGGKVDHMGGSIVGLRLSWFSENVLELASDPKFTFTLWRLGKVDHMGGSIVACG